MLQIWPKQFGIDANLMLSDTAGARTEKPVVEINRKQKALAAENF